MILLALLSSLFLPSIAGLTSRAHLSESLRLKCEDLSYRTNLVENGCYFAVFGEFKLDDASVECSDILFGSKVSTKIPSSSIDALMVDKSQFHLGRGSSGRKGIFCFYESDYSCDVEKSVLNAGRCVLRAGKKMNFVDANQYCKGHGMNLPAPSNDLDNHIVEDSLQNGPTWVEKTLVRENGFKWKQSTNFARWSTCDRTSRDSQKQCATDVGVVIDKDGYWSTKATRNQMDVFCVKNAVNDFVSASAPCNYHATSNSTDDGAPTAGAGIGRICYPETRTTTRYSVIELATVETRRGCELRCNAKSKCVAISFEDKGLSSSCALLSSLKTQSPDCTEPMTIFLKKTSDCPKRSANISADLGNDPCVDAIVPSAFQGLGVTQICDPDKSKQFVIRAIDANGRRVTLDNEKHNFIVQKGDMLEYHKQLYGRNSSEYGLVKTLYAAGCALAGGDKCPCAPLKRYPLTDYKMKTGEQLRTYTATPERMNPCKSSHSLMTDMIKYPALPIHAFSWQMISNGAVVNCKAGAWILWVDQGMYSNYAISSIVCYVWV